MRVCEVEGCEGKHLAKGLCNKHYQREYHEKHRATRVEQNRKYYLQNREKKLAKNSEYRRKVKEFEFGVCSHPEGCPKPARGNGGWCGMHYLRVYKTGNPGPVGAMLAPRGSGSVTTRGYRMLFRPGHPNANGQGRIYEHRYVMSEKLGRPLRPGETVHHKDGDRLNNHPDNLELWSKNHGAGQRIKDLLAEVTIAQLQEELNRRMEQG